MGKSKMVKTYKKENFTILVIIGLGCIHEDQGFLTFTFVD